MKVDIIIVTRNRAAQLAHALDSIGRVTIPEGMEASLLVVDNDSPDETAQVVRARRFRRAPIGYAFEPNLGQANGRNRGMAETQGELILFTDDDVEVPPDWLLGMCEPMAEGKAAVVAGGVALFPGLLRPWMSTLHRSWLASSEWLNPLEPESLVGANMGFSRHVLRKVPSFDPELGPGALGFGDDTLFAMQLRKAGHRIYSRLDTRVEHHFHPNRLRRSAWLDLAHRAGKTKAYIMHHWHYRGYRLARARLLWTYSRLLAWRMRFSNDQTEEGCPEEELRAISALGEYQGYLHERRRRPNYDCNGLVKLGWNPTTGARPDLAAAMG